MYFVKYMCAEQRYGMSYILHITQHAYAHNTHIFVDIFLCFTPMWNDTRVSKCSKSRL